MVRIPRLLERFSDREEVGLDVAIERYWPHLPREPLLELFQLIRMEYDLPAGLLRPEDSIQLLAAPFSVRNPLKWIFEEAAIEDATSELYYRLGKRTSGVIGIQTLGDLAARWCHAS
jgi:hypothetical protein